MIHVAGQYNVAPSETFPLPFPAGMTVRLKFPVTGLLANVAITVVFADKVTTQEPVPEQPPPVHPAK